MHSVVIGVSVLLCLGLSVGGRRLLDVRSSAPVCPDEWDVSPCICGGRPGAGTMMCNSVNDAAQLQRIFKANKEKESFRDIEMHGSALSSLPSNVFFPHSFFLFFLSNNSIQSVDKDAFKGSEENAQVIRLDGNKLTTFPFEGLAGLNSLQLLALQRNQLTAISDNAFPALEKLANLDLSSNKISSIGKNAFSRLVGLQRLELSNNQLSTLGERSMAIEKQKQPIVILLANNKIESIDEAAFAGLKVETLNLANNKLSVLDGNIFHQLVKDGTEIIVDGNAFDCDHAQMAWLKKVPITLKQRISGFRCTNGKKLDELN